MEQIIKLIRTYRVRAGIAERPRLAEELFRLIEPDLRFFVFAAIRPPVAEDVVQQVLKGVATGLRRFTGGSKAEFWGWHDGIARNKLNCHFRKQAPNREKPMAHDELWDLVEASTQGSPLSGAGRIKLTRPWWLVLVLPAVGSQAVFHIFFARLGG